MCGIAGSIALASGVALDRGRVGEMSCRVAHRGPDGAGEWISPSQRAILAHRRLSIIDLAAGQQPMVTEDGVIGLVFNGEIYNYRELRRELRARGTALRTESDTEVLLELLRRDGTAALASLRGMFAFALWDDQAKRLLLTRDRVGKKPLYYHVEAGVLHFASSLRALRETARTTWRVDTTSLDAYLTLGYVPAPATIYSGVHKLPAGSLLVADGDGVRVERYWSLREAGTPFEGTPDQALDELDGLLQEAVALRLRSDVPLGVFLSGGIDSSLVAALAIRQSGAGVRTFSIGMDAAGFDERAHAAEVARRLGTEHHVFEARPELLATLPEMVWHYGEPFADNSALATWLLAEATRPHVTVALGGDGGDEAFAGYDWYRTAGRLRRMTRVVPPPAFALAGRTWNGLAASPLGQWRRAGQVGRGLTMLGLAEGGDRFAALRANLSDADAQRLYAGALLQARRERRAGLALLERLYEESEGSALRRMRYVDIGSYLADGLLPKVDVATMAHGLEARAPLLDHTVVEFAMRLPDAWLAGPAGGKLPLRRLLARYLPASLFERPKQGFDLPLARWFTGAVASRLQLLPRSERLLDRGWFAPSAVSRMVTEHTSGARDHSQRLFSLLVLDEWLARE